jgi:hypothetical protein
MNAITLEQVIIESIKTSNSMAEAAIKSKVHFNTFKRIAIKLGIYNPNRGGKGHKKPWKNGFSLDDILAGKHPQYQTFKLKNQLFKAGIFKNECSICGINSWNGKSLNCELDHVDGNRFNHKIENLRIICPNCHSQTETFRAKNIK